eukprot:TRINITY_DN44561_c0_g1_i1.p1 TRINITY_DN44561_c0_g1~~TRINITY_DN44561_c0_g1_i1.p1  ORF type:complete len:308 (+),score=58.73 TRINITY_DN44561_c0_g1_i1:70-993(+)
MGNMCCGAAVSPVTVTTGGGGLEKVVMTHGSGAEAEVYLWGATLTRYKTAAGREMIFCSPGAVFDGKKAIRGGIPLVFPQFGQPDKRMPQHGFARTSKWTLLPTPVGGNASGDVVCTFALDCEASEAFPHTCRLLYTVTLASSSLLTNIKILNTGVDTIPCQTLLHTYLKVPDVAKIRVLSLKGAEYIDKVDGGAVKTESDPAFPVLRFVDRIYKGTVPWKMVTLKTDAGAKFCSIMSQAALTSEDGTRTALNPDIVVWNPNVEASPGDLPPPAWKTMLCVEPGLVSKTYEIPPEHSMVLEQTLLPE